MNRKEMLATLAGAPLAVLALAREARAGKDGTPLSPAREAIRARYFPNVVLTTHEGKRVRFFDDLIRRSRPRARPSARVISPTSSSRRTKAKGCASSMT